MSAPWLKWPGARPETGWQGIHRLALDLSTTPATLGVHLLRPVDPAHLQSESFSITGGRRIRNIPWKLVPDPSSSTDVIKLELQAIGDHSTYTVTLLDGGGDPIDPFFASADFIFTIDCQRGDCRPAPVQADRDPQKRPAVDLLTKDYAGFVQLLADRVRVTNPHWADLTPASLERVLLELISHHGDMLSYYQDRVANEAFIDDASQRYSLRQHGLLLGYELFDGTAAETTLAFESTVGGYVPQGLEVSMVHEPDMPEVVFYVLYRTRVLPAHNRLSPAAWPGASDAVIPAGATQLLLFGHVENLEPGQRLAFVQGSFSQVVTLLEARHEMLPGWTATPEGSLDQLPHDVTAIRWDPPLVETVNPWPSEDFRLYGNLAQARFGKAHTTVIPMSAAALEADPQSYIVVREHRAGGEVVQLRALRIPHGPVVFATAPSETTAVRTAPLIKISFRQQDWQLVEHLHASQSYDAHFVATSDEDGALWLQFGDGRKGASIDLADPPEIAMTLEYRIGNPLEGNCAAGKLIRIEPPADETALSGLGTLTVTNVVPGRGGRPPETSDAARLRIADSLRHGPLEHAVSLDDYARAALDVPGIARATARDLGGAFNTVLVLVDPEGQTELSPSLRKAVMARIESVRMVGREHVVREPEYVPLEIRLAICVQPGALPHRVRDAVYAALRPGSRQRAGFFHPDRLSFGEDIELGDVLAHVQNVAGVRSVKALRFRKLRVSSANPVQPRIQLRPTEVARLDADDDYPEYGRLEVLVVGVDAGITEQDFDIVEVA